MPRWFRIVFCFAVAAAVSLSLVGASAQEHREKADADEAKAMNMLLETHPEAKGELDKAYGYAVIEISVAWGSANFADKQGEGVGVAVEKSTQNRTYMECTANPDHQITESHIIFLFEDEAAFKSFVAGWTAGKTKKKAEVRAGLAIGSGFVGGIKVYELNQGQLLEEAAIWASSYRPSKHLNEK